MDFLINRTNILEALTNENPKIEEDLGGLGILLANLVRDCGIDPAEHYITKLNNEIMFDEIFSKVIGTKQTFLMECLTGESGRGQHRCKENELIFAHIGFKDFPEAYEGVEKEYMFDFGNILVENGFKEITEDLRLISNEIDFEIKNTRSFIYTLNEFGREFAPMFDQIVQYNSDLEAAQRLREEEERDMNPDHIPESPDVGYKYYVSFTYTKQHSSKGTQIGNQLICIDYPLNSVESIDALSKYIEGTVEDPVPGSIMILAFSYMGIERFEEPDEPEEVKVENDDYFLDEEDGDHPAVESVAQQIEKAYYEEQAKLAEQQKKAGMYLYKIYYTTSEDEYKIRKTVKIPSYITMEDATDDQLAEVVRSYENIAADIDISVSGLEQTEITPGEIPTQVDPENEYEIVQNAD